VPKEVFDATPRTGARRTVISTISEIPNFLRLLYGLVTDSRVANVDKLVLAGAIAYILMPIDIIPDFIPFIGEVDDVDVEVQQHAVRGRSERSADRGRGDRGRGDLVSKIAAEGATPLLVAEGRRALGVIALRDIVKEMLTTSDDNTAELLLKEMGYVPSNIEAPAKGN